MSTQKLSKSTTVRRLITVVVVVAAGVATAAPAYAATRYWNSQSSPLTAYSGDKKLAQGYGTWNIGTTTNGTRSRAYGYLRDPQPSNGYKIYFELFTQTNSGYCIQPDYTSCNAQYYYYAKQFSDFDKETWGSSSWSPQFYASTGVASSGNYARAQMQVAESNYGPDSDSGSTFTKGNAY